MIKRRAKGNNYELKIVSLFKELGWTEACTSRSESKRLDDLGVDVCYTAPFSVQCKATEKLGNHHTILKGMPKKKGMYNLIFHKRNNLGSLVFMSQEDFVEILEMLIANKVIKPK